MDITHIFFDIGGVLGTNGWDREQRARAAERFGLDAEFERRHVEMVGDWETGAIDWDEYLDVAVFYEPRPFSREEFRAFMLALSVPDEAAIAIARRLAADPTRTLLTLNNEPEALNVYRIERFGLRPIFRAFFSSCWLGARKPSPSIFHRALALAQAPPAASLFIDDREQNLLPARRIGFQTLHFRGAGELREELAGLGLL